MFDDKMEFDFASHIKKLANQLQQLDNTGYGCMLQQQHGYVTSSPQLLPHWEAFKSGSFYLLSFVDLFKFS